MGRSPGATARVTGLLLIAGVALWPGDGDASGETTPTGASPRGIDDASSAPPLAAPAPARTDRAGTTDLGSAPATARGRPAAQPSPPAPRETARGPVTRHPREVELRYRIVLQRESASPIQRDLALRVERDGRFACRILLPSSPGADGEAVAPAPGLQAADQALLDAVVAAVSADDPGPIPLAGGRSWVQGERRRSPLGERTVGERRLRGTLVDARAYGVDRDGAQFLNTAQLEIWSDVERGWPVLVMGHQRVRHGDADEQRIDVLVEPAA